MQRTPLHVRRLLLLTCLLCIPGLPALAWDATGHRLSAYLAWDRLDSQRRSELSAILQQHPRLDRDFLSAMPPYLHDAGPAARERWLFGQAAVWPDIARGLPDGEQARYNRPGWHWIDGAWVRGAASEQGNLYLGMAPLPDIRGQYRTERPDNVLLALEAAARQLETPETPAPERAIALTWLLHLTGDIHQPLHTGALFSPQRFPDGDRGGNAIRVPETGNLHALWDRALQGPDFDTTLQQLRTYATRLQSGDTAWAPERWLAESRSLLHSHVYPGDVRVEVLRRAGHDRQVIFNPDEDYLNTMREITIQRLALAGARIAGALERAND